MRKTTIIQKRGRREWRKKKEQKRCTEQHYNNKSNRISGHGNDNWYSLLLSSFLHVHSSTSVDCCYACEKCCCPRHFPETLRFAFMRWHNKCCCGWPLSCDRFISHCDVVDCFKHTPFIGRKQQLVAIENAHIRELRPLWCPSTADDEHCHVTICGRMQVIVGDDANCWRFSYYSKFQLAYQKRGRPRTTFIRS